MNRYLGQLQAFENPGIPKSGSVESVETPPIENRETLKSGSVESVETPSDDGLDTLDTSRKRQSGKSQLGLDTLDTPEKRQSGKSQPGLDTLDTSVFHETRKSQWPETTPANPPHWWRITHPDGRAMRLSVWPPSTLDAMQTRYPGAAVHPDDEAVTGDVQIHTTVGQTPLSAADEASIRYWLALIGETEPDASAEVIANCRRNSAARSYFTDRAASELGPTPGSAAKRCQSKFGSA